MLTSLRPALPAALLLLLAGCKDKTEEEDPLTLQPALADPLEIAGVFAGEGVASDVVTVPVFAVNGLGAMIPSSTLTITSDAEVLTATVEPDATGLATAQLRPEARGQATYQATVAAQADEGHAWRLRAAPGALGFPAIAAPAEKVAYAGRGVAWSSGTEVFWSSPDGGVQFRVLSLPEPVLGIQAAAVDTDGVQDLVVWSDSHLVVLRGRTPEDLDPVPGGLYWGAGFAAEEGTLTGVHAIDIDGDTYGDLAVAVNDGSGSWLLWLKGDGAWSWEQADQLHLPTYNVRGISAENYEAGGTREFTLLTEDGILRRYARYEAGWASTTQVLYDLDLGPDARIIPSIDVQGDGKPEILAYGPARDSSTWQAWAVSLGTDPPRPYKLFTEGEDRSLPTELSMTTADLDGNGIIDLFLSARFSTDDGSSTPSQVRAFWSAATQNFRLFRTDGVPFAGSMAVGDLVAGGMPDAILSGDQIVILPGEQIADNPETEAVDDIPWRVVTPTSQQLELDLAADPWVGEISPEPDDIADLVAFVRETSDSGDGGLELQASFGLPASGSNPNGSFRSGVTAALSGTPLDLDVCDGTIYALVQDDGAAQLWVYNVQPNASLGHVSGPVNAGSATHVVCGALSGGEAATVAPDGSVQLWDGSRLGSGSAIAGGAVDVAAVDTNGDGTDELVGCAEDGCSIAGGDFDDDGLGDYAILDVFGLAVTYGAGETYLRPGAGRVWAGDADGDGVDDLVVGEEGRLAIFRADTGLLAPGFGRFVWRPVADLVQFGDLNGDAVPDAFLTGTDTYEGFCVYVKSVGE